jgi:hypothetical protein
VLDPKGLPINVGRTHRSATDAQWEAIRAIYDSCAWPGCDRRLSWCQAHHIHEWSQGGPTDLDNLVPLCSRHHHKVHDQKWKIKLKPTRQLQIHHPNGGLYQTTDPPTRKHPPQTQPERHAPKTEAQAKCRAQRRTPNTTSQHTHQSAHTPVSDNEVVVDYG